MGKKIIAQLIAIKTQAVSILTYQKDRLSVNEIATIEKLYDFVDGVLCGTAYHKQYTLEEYVDALLIEVTMVLKGTRNSEVKKLVKTLEAGIKW